MEKTLVALLTGGGMAALAVVIQQMMSASTARKANEIASAKLLLEKQDALFKQGDTERKNDLAQRVQITAEADRYRRMHSESEAAHEVTRRAFDEFRINCRKHGDLCQIEIRTKDMTGTE